ncbi:MAG: hypothetical protein Q8P06_02590 [Candidatus Azambacteria bacterium]|nr:hypothetical protein [Candidatus Azambacteria bacterium]
MLKWLFGLLASVSSVFTAGTEKNNIVPPAPLNMNIVAYQETYYAPVVADLGNFPRAKSSVVINDNQEIVVKKEMKVIPPVAPTLTPPPPPATPLPPPAPVLPPQDPYLANPEPIGVNWLSMNLTLIGNSNEPNPRVLPEIKFDREYWRIEVFAYWASDIITVKPKVESDYFKLEIYEKGIDSPIYTMNSGESDLSHKLQSFRKPGIYYFKVYTKNPSKWEISFVVSPKMAN